MQVVEFEAEESDEGDVPNDEIWYTATDQVWPNNELDFGATLIDNYFDYNTGEGILTFDGDVTRIPYNAFWDNWSLTSINLPNSVTEIYGSAFYNCWGLTSIYIPESVTYIEPGAFSSCGNLEKFEGWCASEDGRCLVLDNVLLAFAPAGITSYTTPSGVRTIAADSFSSSHDLTEIVISEGVEIIGTSAFSSCTNLSTIILPESILHIRAYAFDYCYSLADITLPSNLRSIEDWAFVNCANLTQITIPDSVQAFGQGILAGCYNLEYIDCQYATEDVRSLIIDGCLFAIAPKDLSSYTVPEEATHIGSGVLCSLEFPVLLHDNISVIGDNAFERCSFSTITLPANLEYLGYAAFLYCI